MELYKIDFNDRKLNFIKSVFIFACLTGLRFSDLMNLKNRNFITVNGKAKIKIRTIKTDTLCEIPANKIVLDIWEKYSEITFNYYSNAHFNKYLKVMLEKSKMFYSESEVFDEETEHYLEKWQTISIHSARHTFCTIMVNEGVSINKIMGMTGHKSIQNFNRYLDTSPGEDDTTDMLIDNLETV